MPRSKPPPDNPEQSARFIAFAKEHGADEEAESFERGFKTLAPQKRPAETPPQRGRSTKPRRAKRK
jgi:hypothetical protein